MKSGVSRQQLAAAIVLLCLFYTSTGAFAQGDDASMVELHGGTATFDAATNVSVISIHGKSTALEGRARIRRTDDGLVIEQLEAVLPVRTLNTGMGLRDEHMRKYVFTTPDGLLPDMRFAAERAVCSGSGAAKTCQLSGNMVIRDTTRPFAITLKVNDQGNSFRVTGDGVVKLSTYGIPLPTQLGVTTTDDVKLHVDFVVQRVEARIARGTR
jgi:polyisoprenoid-binding protein YceI